MCAVTATEQSFEAWYYDWRSTEELLGHGFERRLDAEFQMIWDQFREVLMMVAEDYDAVSETDSSTNEVTHATRSLRSSPVTEEQLRAEPDPWNCLSERLEERLRDIKDEEANKEEEEMDECFSPTQSPHRDVKCFWKEVADMRRESKEVEEEEKRDSEVEEEEELDRSLAPMDGASAREDQGVEGGRRGGEKAWRYLREQLEQRMREIKDAEANEEEVPDGRCMATNRVDARRVCRCRSRSRRREEGDRRMEGYLQQWGTSSFDHLMEEGERAPTKR